ncbi:3-ketosteroid-9-alpha-hydroxylase [Mycolicibacterium conceptionense]|uniref:3-ketosteroid-9-alpha-hydroxylase n=1 Tax=Mycolicibacterium conceptionense TaxID=451644 RepID=A0A0U1D9P5_9MYCO|nr:ferredoxin--NADP reductase [Mycolicibacterium conceptionense]OBJ91362.1 3-ketosteroid-9-alpha-hydroxylase [Mycolicibacterium conceptionense]OMB77697.1 3-ketosteroid-9-alpha-hydroxylase [Mycolicibacterium conceptionense]OMB85653.1 3-ketosteroid-9-alpha-hydroxylase [Mycolicibacterium conceptionense]OMB86660.1 3-ketosteroid-9-alpha-hydroxylase [Mycolicibacterium conceptionense]ORV22222.1 3-ketosteroid-9-alpha-hydroxylase [Mycolicibacterium conceptionense]
MTDASLQTRRAVLVTVADVIDESPDARSLVFTIPEDQRERFSYRPGQFLTLRVPSELTGSVARCYSLASSPHTDPAPKVTVKRTVDGYGSNWLCDNVKVGDTIEVLPPSGQFTPPSLDVDFLLWAAGSGITPVMSILKSVLSAGTGRVILCYANRDERSVIFAAELRELAARYAGRLTVLHWLETIQGLPTRAQLGGFVRTVFAGSAGFESFICGPAPFMAMVKETLAEAGVPRERIHLEVFRSLSGDPFDDSSEVAMDSEDADAADLEVDLDGTRHRLRWPRSATLVDVLAAAGVDVPYSCKEGQCGSCAATVVRGDVDMAICDILEPDDLADGVILGCQAKPVSDHIHIEF